MNRKVFEYDSVSLGLGKVKRKVGKTLLWVLVYVMVTVTMTVLAYGVFSIFFRTDVEKQLSREIKMYEQLFPSLVPEERNVGEAIAALQYKDNRIYEQVFHSEAPAADPMSGLDIFFASDTIPQIELYSYTLNKSDSLLSVSSKVEEAFMKIFDVLSDSLSVIPPMTIPVSDVTYSQVGASVGKKMDPFYKAYVFHEGLDILVPRGSDVHATGDGTVLSVKNSKKFGRTVEIEHEGGYRTSYSHLETVSVKAGQRVGRGDVIATVGMSGKSFAPHLHYELTHDGRLLDPVHYLFASVTPADYANMLYMAVNTMQSMD
ncbi:MAG TPA: hypothetical protein DHU72_02790 [Rikenellaceae bacterium]|nr:hypothetical protein [Rikenellaceae bacterium]HCZ22398.1 hypothetical protein [Rikenellaceae bacterium]